MLIQINDPSKREYYELESANNGWTARETERQINSQLYERLLLSNDKESILAVARKERIPQTPQEVIKEPMVLEFLGLERKSSYYEKDLEGAIISHLTDFLLELGNGFSFVARQKRICQSISIIPTYTIATHTRGKSGKSSFKAYCTIG